MLAAMMGVIFPSHTHPSFSMMCTVQNTAHPVNEKGRRSANDQEMEWQVLCRNPWLFEPVSLMRVQQASQPSVPHILHVRRLFGPCLIVPYHDNPLWTGSLQCAHRWFG
jgi:hypothetical protein